MWEEVHTVWPKKRKVKKDNQSIVTKQDSAPIWKKVILTTCLGVGITAGSVYAESFESSIPTVYHVYMDEEHIGTVDDREVVKSYIEERVNKAEKEHKDLDLTIGENVSYIPEKMFRPSYNNEKVLESLKEDLSIKVDATKVSINGELLGYVEDRQQADQAIEQIKRKYVSKAVLDKVNNPSSEKSKAIDLEIGDSTVLDVSLSEKVSFSKEKVVPQDILSVEQLVKLLEKGTLKEKVHKIQSGDVLGKVASNYNLSTQELLELNPDLDENSVLQLGQKVNVTAYDPYLDVEVTEEERKKETIEYKTEVKESEDMFKGQKKVEQQGQEGSKEMHYKITKKNGEVVKKELLSEKVLKEPVKKVVIKGTKVIPSRGTGNFAWPAVGGTITSKLGMRWGSYHKGIDIAGVSNRTLKASDNGVVESAGREGGYGNKVVINHNNGYKTIYAHMSSIKVRKGQTVRKGQAIGMMGTTGHSTGVHLHFELHKNGSVENPLNYISR